MTPEDREQRRRVGSLGGLTSSSRMSPRERSERARIAGLASAEAKRRERERRRAAGENVPEPAPRRNDAYSKDELEPYLRELDDEGNALTYDERIREAIIRRRLDIARQAYDSLGTGEA